MYDLLRGALDVSVFRAYLISVAAWSGPHTGDTMTTKTTTYRIRATWQPSPGSTERHDCTSSETMGDYLGQHWTDRAEAERVAEEMEAEVGKYDLHPSTRYVVEEA